MRIYKFSGTAYDWAQMADCHAMKVAEKLEAGVALTRDDKNDITRGGIFSGGVIRLYGWAFDFTPHMKRYVVKLNGYGWQEYRGFDKTAIRASLSGVLEIVELEK